MKRKLLTVLFALATTLCLCFGLAACRDQVKRNEDPEEPAPMEGYWTGATAHIAMSETSEPTEVSFAASVKLVDDTAYVVCAITYAEGIGTITDAQVGYILTKQTDGSYSFTYDPQKDEGHMVGKLNADDKLEIVTDLLPLTHTGLTLTFTTKADLPAGLGLTGIWYALIADITPDITNDMNYRYPEEKTYFDFTNKKLCVSDTEGDITIVEVGNYTFITLPAYPNTIPAVICKSGSDYFIGVLLMKLTQTAPETPTPPAADPIEGYWAGGIAEIYEYPNINRYATTATIDVDGDNVRAILTFADFQNGVIGDTMMCEYLPLEKQEDGSYTYQFEMPGFGRESSFEIKLIDNKLQIVVTNLFQNDDPVTINFTTKSPLSALPAAPEFTGIKYTEQNEKVVEINFDATPTPTIKYDGNFFTDVKLVDVGTYKLFTGKYDSQDAAIIISKEGTKTYAYTRFIPMNGEKYEFEDTKPLTPEDVEGKWTGATVTGIFGDGRFDVTADIDVGWQSGYVVLLAKTSTSTVATNAPAEHALAFYIIKSGDQYIGELTISPSKTYDLIITFEEGHVIIEGLGNDTLTFTTMTALPAQIEIPRGIFHAEDADGTVEFNLMENQVTVPGGQPRYANVMNAGEFIVVSTNEVGFESITYIIFKDGDTYYCFGAEGPIELTMVTP